jgi:hypothetical protein
MMAVAAMAMQTRKLLDTHTNLGPRRLHMGSIRNELKPRTICRCACVFKCQEASGSGAELI